MINKLTLFTCILIFLPLVQNNWAAKVTDFRAIDNEHIMVTWKDGEFLYRDDGQGPCAYKNTCNEVASKIYGEALNTSQAMLVKSYSISSSDDPDFTTTGKHPMNVWRKSKVNGSTILGDAWFLDHTLYLKLPMKLKQGKSYRLALASDLNSENAELTLTFDVYNSISEAIHVNTIGYAPSDKMIKSADIYMWLGSGGGRNYQAWEGQNVILYNTETKEKTKVGKVTFWKNSTAKDIGFHTTYKSDIWNCDFSAFDKTGKFKLVIEDIGCSPEFELREDVYRLPYKTQVRGYYYMRIGQDSVGLKAKQWPIPRRPLYIPNQDPPGFKVYLTSLVPGSSEWKSLGKGDNWDVKDWSKYRLPGNPTNPKARGGHSDALDWDRNFQHVSNIWDLLLPYVITDGILKDDNLDIAESGNGIPDIIDEARNEVDFWLNLRDPNGAYCMGLNNPGTLNGQAVMYQAAATTIMAWANAANCAMLSAALKISGNETLSNEYKDSALAAFHFAETQSDQELDSSIEVGDATISGKELKQSAAAYLYNVTGQAKYENLLNEHSSVTSDVSEIIPNGGELWAIAGYLKAKHFGRSVNYPNLQKHMVASILYQAKKRNISSISARPSRRSTDDNTYWFQSAITVHLVCLAHLLSESDLDRSDFKKALLLEADYSLGRNSLNQVLMTGLGARDAGNIYTSGQNDGVPGLHPGHTPYMNAVDWGGDWWAGKPTWLESKGFPEWSQWPNGEALWNCRYHYSNSEFTPQQTMRGKMVLYAYLYAISNRDGTSSALYGSKAGGLSDTEEQKLIHETSQLVELLYPGQKINIRKEGFSQFEIRDINGHSIAQGSDAENLNQRYPVSGGLWILRYTP